MEPLSRGGGGDLREAAQQVLEQAPAVRLLDGDGGLGQRPPELRIQLDEDDRELFARRRTEELHNGPTGTVKLEFQGKYAEFTDWTMSDDPYNADGGFGGGEGGGFGGGGFGAGSDADPPF